jgi:hypothetical protein
MYSNKKKEYCLITRHTDLLATTELKLAEARVREIDLATAI